MTCTDDRLEELDFPTPEEMIPDPPNLLEEPDFDLVPCTGTLVFREEPHYAAARRAIDAQRERYADEDRLALRESGPYFEQYCWCSPGRGMFFDRHRAAEYYMEWPEPVTLTRWVPSDEQHVMSRELVVINPT